jgi:hypothetical protein
MVIETRAMVRREDCFKSTIRIYLKQSSDIENDNPLSNHYNTKVKKARVCNNLFKFLDNHKDFVYKYDNFLNTVISKLVHLEIHDYRIFRAIKTSPGCLYYIKSIIHYKYPQINMVSLISIIYKIHQIYGENQNAISLKTLFYLFNNHNIQFNKMKNSICFNNNTLYNLCIDTIKKTYSTKSINKFLIPNHIKSDFGIVFSKNKVNMKLRNGKIY